MQTGLSWATLAPALGFCPLEIGVHHLVGYRLPQRQQPLSLGRVVEGPEVGGGIGRRRQPADEQSLPNLLFLRERLEVPDAWQGFPPPHTKVGREGGRRVLPTAASASAPQASCLVLGRVAKCCVPAAAAHNTCTSKAVSRPHAGRQNQKNTFGSKQATAGLLAKANCHGFSWAESFSSCGPLSISPDSVREVSWFLFCCYNNMSPQE